MKAVAGYRGDAPWTGGMLTASRKEQPQALGDLYLFCPTKPQTRR